MKNIREFENKRINREINRLFPHIDEALEFLDTVSDEDSARYLIASRRPTLIGNELDRNRCREFLSAYQLMVDYVNYMNEHYPLFPKERNGRIISFQQDNKL